MAADVLDDILKPKMGGGIVRLGKCARYIEVNDKILILKNPSADLIRE
jgi:hypothetical protein